MQRHRLQNLEWLEFDLLNDVPTLKHAVFLRHGGVSEGPYKSLNTSFQMGDRDEHVRTNIDIIKTQLQLSVPQWKHMVIGRGKHGSSIAVVNPQSPEEIIDFDGVMTSFPDVTLMMRFADCQIGLFYDPIHHVIANIHSGWRGQVANIYSKAIQQMQQVYGSNPADLLVCISPSLGPDEAEFIHYRSELPEEFWSFQVRPTYFDFWSITEYQLQSAGILPHHIEVARLSTYSNPLDFFSHRRDKITGRHAACLTLL